MLNNYSMYFLHVLYVDICIKQRLRGQSKSEAYLMVRKSDNLCVVIILKETLF